MNTAIGVVPFVLAGNLYVADFVQSSSAHPRPTAVGRGYQGMRRNVEVGTKTDILARVLFDRVEVKA